MRKIQFSTLKTRGWHFPWNILAPPYLKTCICHESDLCVKDVHFPFPTSTKNSWMGGLWEAIIQGDWQKQLLGSISQINVKFNKTEKTLKCAIPVVLSTSRDLWTPSSGCWTQRLSFLHNHLLFFYQAFLREASCLIQYRGNKSWI